MTMEALIDAGLRDLAVVLDTQQQEKLLAYLQLLQKWNRVYNLTAIRDLTKMVSHHLLDSLSILPHLRCERLLDVGTGAGLPGIPLAIARPAMSVTMLDSSHKKATFVQQCSLELGLQNAATVCARVDQWQAPESFDAIVSRAFADLAEFARLVRPHLSSNGRLLAMKGLYPYEELAQLPTDLKVEAVIPLTVPGLGAQRHLVVMTPERSPQP